MCTFQAFIKAFLKGSFVDSSESQWKHCGNRIILTEINNTLASVSHQMYMELSLTACFYPNKVNWLVLQNLKPQPRTVGTYLVGFICHWTHACKFSKPVYTKVLIILAVISKKKKQKKTTPWSDSVGNKICQLLTIELWIWYIYTLAITAMKTKKAWRR